MKKYVLPLLLAVVFGMVLGALGYCTLTFMVCYMGSPLRYPVTLPVSIVGCVVCTALAALLVWLYVRLRRKYPSRLMTMADVLLAVAVLLPALWAWAKLAQILEAHIK